MTYIITDPCVGTCDTACVEVCPVDCIHGPDDPEGSVADASNDFDISVSVGTTSGVANISYFSIASDPVFEEYMAWNSKITSRESLVISKASRDEYPLSCNGEQFTNDKS